MLRNCLHWIAGERWWRPIVEVRSMIVTTAQAHRGWRHWDSTAEAWWGWRSHLRIAGWGVELREAGKHRVLIWNGLIGSRAVWMHVGCWRWLCTLLRMGWIRCSVASNIEDFNGFFIRQTQLQSILVQSSDCIRTRLAGDVGGRQLGRSLGFGGGMCWLELAFLLDSKRHPIQLNLGSGLSAWTRRCKKREIPWQPARPGPHRAMCRLRICTCGVYCLRNKSARVDVKAWISYWAEGGG